MNIKLSLLSLVVCFILSSCWGGDNRSVTNNNVYKTTTLWNKQTKESFIIDLSGKDNLYGSFVVEQEGEDVMALDFVSILSNSGRNVVFRAIPRENLLTEWQRKRMNDETIYEVSVDLDQSGQYIVKFANVPPGYEEEFGNKELSFKMFLKDDVLNDYFKDIEFQELQLANGKGAALYFGNWVNLIYQHLFIPYAIIFAILAFFRGKGALWHHIILTVILFATFNLEFGPGRAFIASYYLCTPLLYVPYFRNSLIRLVTILGLLISMAYLGYKDWLYVGLIEWVIDIAGWSVTAIIAGIIFLDDLSGRCPNCGRFALSWRGRTPRFEQAIEHFKHIKVDGSDTDEMVEDPTTINPRQTRCGHCMATSNGETF